MATSFPGNRWDQARATDAPPAPAPVPDFPTMSQADFFKKVEKTPEQKAADAAKLRAMLRNSGGV